MNKRFASGLVVGKFCPLHRGHELVIRRALADCDRVFILSYTNPEFPGCETERRERWLAQLFPDTTRLVLTDEGLRALGSGAIPPNDADEKAHRRLVAWVCENVWHTHVDAVFTSENYGEPYAASLAQLFRKPVAHVSVDPARDLVPISGTQLRADIHMHRAALSHEVYASFVERVCLLGGESSGKTTLAEALARDWETEWVPEFGRELWLGKAGRLELDDMLAIAREQIIREEAGTLRANRFLFCDTSPLATLFYSREMFGRSDSQLDQLAVRRYDRTILCTPDFPFIQDGTRRPPGFREQQHAWYLDELTARGIPFLLASGPHPDRVSAMRAAIQH